MKTSLTLMVALCFAFVSHARLMQWWPYDVQMEKAALVVIATPTKVAETSELATALPNIVTVHNDGMKEDVMAKGVETSFEVVSVLKGERGTKTFVLHHFKLVKPGNDDGPMLVSFKPGEQKRYLMFLQKEADGRYVAVCGQTDPGNSIKELSDVTDTSQEVTKQFVAIWFEIDKMKPGRTRADLESLFRADTGGVAWPESKPLPFQQHQQFDYRSCWLIKVDVEFAPSDSKEARPKDVISRISKPYLDGSPKD
jgi:hypothetical protein